MTRHQLVAEWQVAAPRPQVWDALLGYRSWPTWWRGFRSVEQLAPGEESGVGMQIRQRWRSLLPYTLTFDLTIHEIAQQRLLRGAVTGDLDGSATWTFDEIDGGTRVRFLMDVRPARAWMNLPLPFAGQVFRANFDAVMHWGSEGLAGLLGMEVVDRTAAARREGALVPANAPSGPGGLP